MLFEGFIGFILIIISIYILLYIDTSNKRKSLPKDYPPGPTTLPLLENFYFSSSNLIKTVEKLRKKFGDIIGLQFGQKNVVIISDYELIQEAYNTPALCGKNLTEVDMMLMERHKDLGHGFTGDHEWGNLERKFILKTLRDFGFGPKTIESMIQDDCLQLITILKFSARKQINPILWVQLAVFNSLLRFITNENHLQKDPKLKKLFQEFETVMSIENINIPTLATRFLPPQLSGKKKLENALNSIESFLKKKIEEHKLLIDKNNDDGFNNDFMDAYIQEIKNTKDTKSPFYKNTGELNLLLSCLNLIGGSRKTSSTIILALYHIGNDENIQKKLHNEIDRHIGLYRLPGIKDKLSMPYTEAIMLETFRMSSVTPFGNPLNSTEEVYFHGYKIPEDTLILTNLHDVHNDTKHWENPQLFRPERFLTSNEKEIVKQHRPVIWSTIGKKTIPNELLGSDTFFIFITSIFQRLNLRIEGEKGMKIGFDTVPNFKIIVEDRLEFLDRNEESD